MVVSVHVWSDVVCPWCFLGKRRLERAIDAFQGKAEVIWHSFELDSLRRNESVKGESAAQRLATKYGMSVERAVLMMDQMIERGRGEGIEFDLHHTKTLQSFDAHRLLQFAAPRGKQSAMKERLFVAHFTEGMDLGDKEVLQRVGEDVGLSPIEVREMLSSDAFSREVRQDEETARELGITGVPFFVIGKYGISGAQSSDVLLDALEKSSRAAISTALEP